MRKLLLALVCLCLVATAAQARVRVRVPFVAIEVGPRFVAPFLPFDPRFVGVGTAPLVPVTYGQVGTTFTDQFGRTFAFDAFGRPVQIGGPVLR
jgi:hypothetical protein